MSSSYFDTSKYLNQEVSKSPFSFGSNTNLFDYKKILNKNEKKEEPDEGKKDEVKGFLAKQVDNVKSYLEATKENKSEEDKDRDLIRELAGVNNQTMRFGDSTKGFATEVAQGLNIFQPGSAAQQMFIPGEKAQGKSLGQRLAGAAVGLGKGLLTGTPHGGAIGAGIGFFS